MTSNHFFQKRTPDEWNRYAAERWVALRIFVQENGEKAAVLGFVVGVFIVLFFKLFVFVFCIIALSYLIALVSANNAPKS